MVILITGATHTGKTMLAQRMLEKYRFPSFSMDHLKMGLIRSGQTQLTPEDDEELTAYLWPIVREIIKTAIENQQNLIIEGCYVPFAWRRDFTDAYLSAIRFICLCMSEVYIDAHCNDILSHGSDLEKRLDDTYVTLDLLKKENRRCAEGFLAAGERITSIDDDYQRSIEAVLSE